MQWKEQVKKKGGHPENPIQRARVKAGFTQEQAIEHLPFTLRTLQAYEAGDAEPKYSAVRQMALLYGCSTDVLMGNTEPHSAQNTEATSDCTNLD